MDLFLDLDIKKSSRPNEYWANCVLCPERIGREDTNYHLGFNIKTGRWQCFRCGAKTSTHGPLDNIDDLSLVGGDRPERDLETLKNKIISLDQKPERQTIDLDEISWKISPNMTPFAYDYMRSRGFTDQEIGKYGLRAGHEFKNEDGRRVKKWKGRILFPFFERGECIYIVGRSYLGKEPKYINSTGSKNNIVYGLDRVTNGECIIAEGIISAIAAERATGIPAVSLLGKSASLWQLTKIQAKAKRVYLSLDGGVNTGSEGTANLRQKLLFMGLDVWLVELPYEKDPDDLRDEYTHYFNQSKKISIF